MGKDLKGKNLGEGISQRKDGKYTARYTGRNGKRFEKHFDKVTDAKKWLAEARYENEHINIGEASQMTVNAWFDFWITEVKEKTTKANTVRNYKERYNRNVKDIIGNMVISEVKPLNCQMVLNQMLALRHTFATRAIEANMNPKTLQVILGHSDVSITMGLYVHVTEDEKIKQMKKFEEAICIG
ncbi:MAG: tyrosine-type recombinase/integrase [Ruminococcaceae bacterium]|nr:tyrosine-type recombinase/integrase [Oscillospiraceae bacterium]